VSVIIASSASLQFCIGPGTKKNEVFVYDHHPPSDEDIPALADHCLVKPLGSCTALLLHEEEDQR
jgi:nanoRNase/pAp phosphatase (c-di-AMP/oligoRNAs hydrolase)